MKKNHYQALKLHAIYSLILAIIFAVIIILVPDLILGVTMVFLLAYVAGNGLIHSKSNQLERDTLVEYILLALIALIVVIGSINR